MVCNQFVVITSHLLKIHDANGLITNYILFAQSASAGLVQLIKPALNVQDIPAFLLRHLEKDVTLLGKALGRSVDEAVLVIHLVLHDILVKDVPRCQPLSESVWSCALNIMFLL